MFDVVLVTARGAAASRLVRSCQRLDVQVAVAHDDQDRGSLPVRLADEAVPLGGRSWAESYGDPRKVVEAAQRSGAGAVHPGAGPLAVDLATARAVEDAGLAWLGLPSAVLARGAGADLADAAGLPLLEPGDAADLLLTVTLLPSQAAVRRAWTVDDRPVLERSAEDVAPDVRSAVVDAARAAAQAADAGAVVAVDLAMGRDGALRLAGLAPVATAGSRVADAVLGVDVVEAQLRVAAGDRPQKARGGRSALALSVRAADSFAGRVRRYRLPQTAAGLLVDSGVGQGAHVAAGSDRLLAVLTVVGDAADVRRRAQAALDEVEVAGLPTTLPLLRAALDGAADPAGPDLQASSTAPRR